MPTTPLINNVAMINVFANLIFFIFSVNLENGLASNANIASYKTGPLPSRNSIASLYNMALSHTHETAEPTDAKQNISTNESS